MIGDLHPAFENSDVVYYRFERALKELDLKTTGWDLNKLKALAKFRSRVKSQFEVNPWKDYRTAISEIDGDSQIKTGLINVSTGKIGKVRKINCLEASIVDFGLAHLSDIEARMEIGAEILLKGNKLRILLAISKRDSSVVVTEWVHREIESSIREGYRFEADFHTHPFAFTQNPDSWTSAPNLLAPSIGDESIYTSYSQEFSLRKALITEGFFTFEYTRNNFGRVNNVNF